MRGVLLILLLLPVAAFSQNTEIIALNEITSPKLKSAAINPAFSYTDVNDAFFNDDRLKRGTRFLFESSPGIKTELIITRVTRYTENTVSIIARKPREINNEFMLTYSNGRITGTFYESPARVLQIGYQKETATNFITAEPLFESLPDENGAKLVAPFRTPKDSEKRKDEIPALNMQQNIAALAASVDDSITIDVLLVYTDAAQTWANSSAGSIDEVMAEAMNKAQTAHDNSNTRIKFRLVHAMKTAYDETIDGVDSEERLNRLTKGLSGFLAVHTARDEYGADLVALLARINDTGGLGWIMGSTAGDSEYGFSLNRVQQIASGYTLVHEMGHNMGNNHSRTQKDQAAPDQGGIFHYSAGYQDLTNRFYTIMAYADGMVQAPLFSSPDLLYKDYPAGTNHNEHPEDNARSMREVKRIVAGFRPTKVDPPVLSPLTNTLNVVMNREDENTVPVALNNTGISQLMWAVDFDLPANIAPKVKSPVGVPELERLELPATGVNPVSLPFTDSPGQKNKTGEEVVYETSFEESEGFSTGNHKAQSGWRSFSDGDVFSISGVNAKSGTSHLRIESKGDSQTRSYIGPFIGLQPFGSYEVEMDFAITGTGASTERYDIYFNDGKNDELAAGLVIAEGNLYIWGRIEANDPTFLGTGTIVSSKNYKKLRIVFDNEAQNITYFLGGTLVATRPYIDGRTPDQIAIFHGNSTNNNSLDIDNIKITRKEGVYPWLFVNRFGGVVSAGETQDLNLIFNTRGVAAGDYYTQMIIQTNDPSKQNVKIPVHLTVNAAVSNEAETGRPLTIELSQNYPNPFNPETIITYSIKEASDVRLEIFDIQGRMVAVPVNESAAAAGQHTVRFNAGELASGVYFYRLKASGQILTKRMVVLK